MSNTMNAAMTEADIDAMIAGAKAPYTTIPICFKGDLANEWKQLEARLNATANADATSLGGNPEVEDLKEQVRDLTARMDAASMPVQVQAVPKKKADKIVEGLPPRDGNDMDKRAGFDREAVDWALIREGIVWPSMADDARWAAFSDVLTTHQFNKLLAGMNDVNFNEVDSIPFSYVDWAKQDPSDES